jgi:four helix bundle protein
LVGEAYSFSRAFPEEEKFGLTAQLRRAAISVPSNIAEGVGRNHARDTIQFLYIAKASLNEIETQIFLAYDLCFCDKKPARKCSKRLLLSESSS